LARNTLERRVIVMWRDKGYASSTIEKRIRDKRKIYRRLAKRESDRQIVRRLTCANVTRAIDREARCCAGNKKLNARIMKASLKAWVDALRTLGKRVPPWAPHPSRTSASGLINEYWAYTHRVRGLAESTFKDHRLYVTYFLEDLKRRKIALGAITLVDVDRFVITLTTRRKLALTTAANVCICIRHFLRFLYRTKRIGTDLAPAVTGPSMRQMLKRPPTKVSWALLQKVLNAIDRTQPIGKRDYAIFITAASYGWGAAELLSLRLDDIDWHRNTLAIVRPKTGVRIEVPLRPQVAHALSSYIRYGRPRNTDMREVFLRHNGPRAKVPRSTTIASQLERYARKAGIPLPSYGLKLFRCYHIAEQLNRGVPAKVIADVVGHSDTRSISRYAGVNFEQLRTCALPVPS
jgi:site-specific recombinase XerD